MGSGSLSTSSTAKRDFVGRLSVGIPDFTSRPDAYEPA
jgi:hypothetical protein